MIVKGGTYFLDLSDFDLSSSNPVTYAGLYADLVRIEGKALTLKVTFGTDLVYAPATFLIGSSGIQVTGSAYDATNESLIVVSFQITDEDAVTPAIIALTPASE